MNSLMKFNQKIRFNYYHQIGLLFALAPTVIHFNGANAWNVWPFACLFMIYFAIKLYGNQNVTRLANVVYQNKLITGLFVIFLLSPYVGSLVITGALFETPLIVFESLFRLCFFFLMLLIGSSDKSSDVWKSYILFFSIVYIFFILAVLINPSMKFTNSSGLCVVLGAIYFHYIFNKTFKFILFIFTIFFLYDVMISRTLAVAYVVFHVYMEGEIYFKNYFKKWLIFLLAMVLLLTIFWFIRLDSISSEVGRLNSLTSGRGVIWSHYLSVMQETGSILFGVGHSREGFYSNIPSLYDGPMTIMKNVMVMGGVHNSFIYNFLTKGLVGMMALFFFAHLLFKKHLKITNPINIGLFLVSALMMFTTGQSTIGGLTFESELMLMSLLIPFHKFYYSKKNCVIKNHKGSKINES